MGVTREPNAVRDALELRAGDTFFSEGREHLVVLAVPVTDLFGVRGIELTTISDGPALVHTFDEGDFVGVCNPDTQPG